MRAKLPKCLQAHQQWTLFVLITHALEPLHYTLDLHLSSYLKCSGECQTPLSNKHYVFISEYKENVHNHYYVEPNQRRKNKNKN